MFFIFTKFVALTCVFCVGTAVLLDVGFALGSTNSPYVIVGIAYARWSWLILWGLVWLGSFSLAWHLLTVPHLARMSKE